MSKLLEMVYKTDLGKEVTYSLSDPKDGLAKATVDTYMGNCITKNVYANKSGKLSSVVKSQIRETIVTKLV